MLTKFSKKIKTPAADNQLSIFSDGNDDYSVVLKELFPVNCMNYGQIIKIREKGRVVDKIKRT